MFRHVPHVLVVDDLADAADTMATLLNLCGYDCESHYSGETALVSARDQRPDLVLLDLHMPGMDGFEFVCRLREIIGCSRTAIVIISGLNIPKSHARARELGIEHYFSKPVNLRPLLEVMDELLDVCLDDVRKKTELVLEECGVLVTL